MYSVRHHPSSSPRRPRLVGRPPALRGGGVGPSSLAKAAGTAVSAGVSVASAASAAMGGGYRIAFGVWQGACAPDIRTWTDLVVYPTFAALVAQRLLHDWGMDKSWSAAVLDFLVDNPISRVGAGMVGEIPYVGPTLTLGTQVLVGKTAIALTAALTRTVVASPKTNEALGAAADRAIESQPPTFMQRRWNEIRGAPRDKQHGMVAQLAVEIATKSDVWTQLSSTAGYVGGLSWVVCAVLTQLRRLGRNPNTVSLAALVGAAWAAWGIYAQPRG